MLDGSQEMGKEGIWESGRETGAEMARQEATGRVIFFSQAANFFQITKADSLALGGPF